MEDRMKVLEDQMVAVQAEMAKLATFEASVNKTQTEVAKLATFEANVTNVHKAHEE